MSYVYIGREWVRNVARRAFISFFAPLVFIIRWIKGDSK